MAVFRRQYTPKCTNCGNRKVMIPFSGIPPIVGFKGDDGSVINLCSECLINLNRMNDSERKAFLERLGKKHE